MGHLSNSCPLKARRYYEGKTRANAVLAKRRGPYHTKRSPDAVIKGKGREEARDRAEAICLDPAWMRKSREQASALQCEAKKDNARLKHEEEKDGDCGSVQKEERQKEARRQYNLKRYANPAVREKARARYREAAKAKATLKGNEEESNHDDPSFRLGRPLEARRQHNAKRQRDPAARERRKERKRVRYEVIEPKAGDFQNDEGKYNDEDNENDDSEPVKRQLTKRESRSDLGDELNRLKKTDLGLAEAIIGFHRGLTTVLQSSHGRDQLQGFRESRKSG